MKKNKLLIYVRWMLLAIFLIIIIVQGYLHQIKGGDKI